MKFSDIDLLSVLDQDEYAGLRRIFKVKRYSRGAAICHPYATDNLVFIIYSGRVRVYLAYEEKEFTLAYLEKGDLYATHTQTYVEAMEDTKLLVSEIGVFREELNEFPVFMPTMVRVLGHMLQNSFGIIESLAFKDVRKRIVDLLIREAIRSGTREEEGLCFQLGLTMEQLSKLVGASRQTVSTLINDLSRMGLLEKSGRGRYCITDIEQLKHTTLQE